jgi:hypothetical protein
VTRVRTLRDWIELGDLEAAERAVSRAEDWIDLAEAYWARRDVTQARRLVDAGVAAARGDHFTLRRAAKLYLRGAGDRVDVARVLGQAREETPQDLLQLAGAHRELLQDDAVAETYLARARAAAVEVEHLLALARSSSGAEARGFLERAEARMRARGEWREAWSVANLWVELGERAGAEEILEAATRAGDLSTLTTIALAWHSALRDEAGPRRALCRAEEVATGSGEWLRVAEAYRDGGDRSRVETWDPPGVARCLEAALLGATDDDRARIERAFRGWLGDDDRADLLLAPAPAPLPLRRLAGWPHRDPSALLELLCQHLDDAALKRIAQADFADAWPKHLLELRRIRDEREVPHPLDWHPAEVLARVRWSTGAGVDHVARAFACVVLAVAVARGGETLSFSDTLGALVESVSALGWHEALDAFLVWLVEVMPLGWPSVALIVHMARRDPRDPRLVPLCVGVRHDRLERGVGEERWVPLAAQVRDPSAEVAELLGRLSITMRR